MEKFLIGKFSAIISYRMPLSGDFERTIRNMRLRRSGIDWKIGLSEGFCLKKIHFLVYFNFYWNFVSKSKSRLFLKNDCSKTRTLIFQRSPIDWIEAFLESLIHVLRNNQMFYDYGLFMKMAMKFYLRSCLSILSCSFLSSHLFTLNPHNGRSLNLTVYD